MAVRSIVDIDIQDLKFKEVLALFSKFEKAVAGQPAAWKKVASAAAGTTKELKEQQRAAQAIADGITDAYQEAGKLGTQTRTANREMASLAKSTKAVAGNLKDGALWLLKWGAISGLGAGLIGAGSLFGIAGLAQRTSIIRRESMGLGVSSAQLRALRTNYGSAVDVDSLLSKINEARNDVSKRWLLSANGLSQADIASGSNAELLQKLIPNLRARMLRSNGNAANMPGLTGLVDIDTLTRLSRMSPAELAAMSAATQRDTSTMSVQDQTQQAWQNLQKQLDRAGEQIETTLVNGLVKLSGPLEQLSQSVANMLKSFLENPNTGQWIEAFGRGIQTLGEYLGSTKFQNDMKDGLDALGQLGTAVMKVVKFINDDDKLNTAAGGVYDWFATSNNKYSVGLSGLVGALTDKDLGLDKPIITPKIASNVFGKLEAQHGLPAGILDRLWYAESSRGANMRMPILGFEQEYAGHFQLGKAAAADYGVKDRYDFNDSARGAASYLSDLSKRYNGDISKAVAAYNYGPSNVDKLVQQYGGDWQSHVPAETQREIRVVIENNTGGNAVVNVNQAGQQH